MERIYLTKDEKKVFREVMEQEKHLPIANIQFEMSHDRYISALCELQRKGLLCVVAINNDVVSIDTNLYGELYYKLNPTLKNPVNYLPIICAASAVTAVALLVRLAFHLAYDS